MASVFRGDIGGICLFVTQRDKAVSHKHYPRYCTDIAVVPLTRRIYHREMHHLQGFYISLDWRYSLITKPLDQAHAN